MIIWLEKFLVFSLVRCRAVPAKQLLRWDCWKHWLIWVFRCSRSKKVQIILIPVGLPLPAVCSAVIWIYLWWVLNECGSLLYSIPLAWYQRGGRCYGLFDGLDVDGSNSSAELAYVIDAPVILVVNCTRLTRSAAALDKWRGCFDQRIGIGGVILNNVARSPPSRYPDAEYSPLLWCACIGNITQV